LGYFLEGVPAAVLQKREEACHGMEPVFVFCLFDFYFFGTLGLEPWGIEFFSRSFFQTSWLELYSSYGFIRGLLG
jgi:hypothetical protein